MARSSVLAMGDVARGKQGVMLFYKAILHKIDQKIKVPLIFTFA